jgi:hypothetical protein
VYNWMNNVDVVNNVAARVNRHKGLGQGLKDNHSIILHCAVLELGRKSRTRKRGLLDCTIHGFMMHYRFLHHFLYLLCIFGYFQGIGLYISCGK